MPEDVRFRAHFGQLLRRSAAERRGLLEGTRMPVTDRTVDTSHAQIAISETAGNGLPLVFLHGNSSCKEVFADLLAGELGDRHRMIAVDLPGHGASGDANHPERTYTMTGYADAMVELLGALAIDRAAIVGWSLGGHVALEMIPKFAGTTGVMIVATPPVGQGAEKVMAGFRPIPNADLVGRPVLDAEEAEMLLFANYGPAATDAFRKALQRTDGRAREVMFRALLAGAVSDQRAIAETAPIPIAVVNGADDPLVNVEYVGGVSYRNLWDNHCYVLRGAGHASFLHAPEAFGAILERFAADVARRGTRAGAVGARTAAA
jgi:pimeloyl-ACP methyl ester carboxylesterase